MSVESVGGKVFGCSWHYLSCRFPRGCSGQHCFNPLRFTQCCAFITSVSGFRNLAAFLRSFHSQSSCQVCVLSLAVVEEHSPNPVVRLGIKGRAKDGWYPVSEIKVSP